VLGRGRSVLFCDESAIANKNQWGDRVVDPRTLIIGEVGLGEQTSPVAQMELCLKEAAKLGFNQAIVPKRQVYGAID
jgi:DNA repair protein RadA/Sms